MPIVDNVRVGWICPHCGRANAPWLPSCCYGKTSGVTLPSLPISPTTPVNPEPYYHYYQESNDALPC